MQYRPPQYWPELVTSLSSDFYCYLHRKRGERGGEESRDSTRLRFTRHAIRNFIAFHSNDVSRSWNRLIGRKNKQDDSRCNSRPTHFEIIDIMERDFSSRQLFCVRLIDHPGTIYIEVLNQIHFLSIEREKFVIPFFLSFLPFLSRSMKRGQPSREFSCDFFSFSSFSLVCCINGCTDFEVETFGLEAEREIHDRKSKLTIPLGDVYIYIYIYIYIFIQKRYINIFFSIYEIYDTKIFVDVSFLFLFKFAIQFC